jgi:hypothetical protein
MKLSDNVLRRFVQIFQESLLLGLDGADLMRMVRLHDPNGDGNLELTSEYSAHVAEWHKKLEAKAEKLQKEREAREKNPLIMVD